MARPKKTNDVRVENWPQIRVHPITYQYLNILAKSNNLSLNIYANNLLTMLVNKLKGKDQ